MGPRRWPTWFVFLPEGWCLTMSERVTVLKTAKLYVNGAFIRSESGRSYEVANTKGAFLANVSQASRKDARDAVRAARSAQSKWASATSYNRGQILYRIAEMMEGRRDQFVIDVVDSEGVSASEAQQIVDAAIDRVVWTAGWSDKIGHIHGTSNPVAGPFFNFSIPEPVGVVVTLAPQDSSLLGLVTVMSAAIVSGNTVVLLASEQRPMPAVTVSEVIATSDVPAGVVNILFGSAIELGPWLAAHMDVNAIDLAGAEPASVGPLTEAAAENLKRVLKPEKTDWFANPSTGRIQALLETKTVWHTIGI